MIFVFLASLGHDEETIFRMIEGDLKNLDSVGPNISPRHLMQTLGTEWGRDCIHPNIWIDIAMSQARNVCARGSNCVIDDLRFENEYDAIAKANGELWKVVRPGTESANGHQSEGRLEHLQFDVVIVNDGTIEDLHRKIAEAAARPVLVKS